MPSTVLVAALETFGLPTAVLVAVSVPVVLVLAVLSGRVLGVRIGGAGALVTAVVGWVVGLVVAASIDTPERGWKVLAAGVFAGLTTMLLVVVSELVSRPGGRPRARPRVSDAVHPVDALRRRLQPLRRGREVARVARSHGLFRLRYAEAGGIHDPQFGLALRDTLQECGGVLVKFGQIASTRTDALPPTVTGPLSDLQSDVAAVPAAAIRPELETGLGRPVGEVFAEFDWDPLAAASIGQTYRARLLDGRPVVVKCRRPGIAQLVHGDGEALLSLAHLLDAAASRDAHRSDRFTILAGELVRNVEREVDFLREATNATAVAVNRADDPHVRIPRVHSDLCSSGVLVMDVAAGVSIAEPGAVAAAARPAPAIAHDLLASFLAQILQDGLYHADPHPGNVFIAPDGTLTLIDFGSVGELDPRVLSGLQLLALGTVLRDPTIVVKGLVRIGSAPPDIDRSALEADVSRILGQELHGGGIDAAMLREVFGVMDRHGIQVPQAFVVLSRALFSLEGTLHLIDPSFDFGRAATEIVGGWYGGRHALDDDTALKQELLRAVVLLRDLPSQIDETASSLLAGRLTVRTSRFGDDAAVVGAWFDRAVVAVVGAVTLLCGALLLVGAALTDAGDGELRSLLTALGVVTLLAGMVLSMRAVARALTPRRR